MTIKSRMFKFGTPTIHESAFVHEKSTVIGDVSLADDCSIWPEAVLRGDVNTIDIGCRSNIQDGAVIHVTHKNNKNPKGWPVKIGTNVTVGHKVCLHGCTIGDNVLLGIGSIVLDGAVIESNTVLAAGSLVPPGKTLQQGYLYMGSPAKQVRALTEDEFRFFDYSAQLYVDLKNSY